MLVFYLWVLFAIILGDSGLCSLSFYLKSVMIAFVFVWVRGTLPRLRYDELLYSAWKSFSPVSINYLMFFVGLKMLCFILS